MTPHEVYGDLADEELIDLWNGADNRAEPSALLGAELRARGYITHDDEYRYVPVARLVIPGEGAADDTDDAVTRYEVKLATTPDVDGDYRAVIRAVPDGVPEHVMYGRDRDELRFRVARWVEFQRSPAGEPETYTL